MDILLINGPQLSHIFFIKLFKAPRKILKAPRFPEDPVGLSKLWYSFHFLNIVLVRFPILLKKIIAEVLKARLAFAYKAILSVNTHSACKSQE